MTDNAKPILFSTPMVQAILRGAKTQTRRVIKPLCVQQTGKDFQARVDYSRLDNVVKAGYVPRYKPSDILYVREAWARISDWTIVDPDVGLPDGYIYKADWGDDEHPRWHPSIFMPKEAARIFLRVTDVRVERVQDISAEDAIAEGALDHPEIPPKLTLIQNFAGTIPQTNFALIWDSINAKRDGGIYAWDTNPFVWCYEFERIEEVTP